MSKRIVTLQAAMDVGAAGTQVIDLNLQEQVSRIAIHWDCTNVTVSVMLANVLACLTQIEVVDGSDVLFSATGEALQGINRYDEGSMPHNHISLTVGDHFQAVCNIDFGRYLWDPMLALRPTMYKNPQLRITFDEDACNTAAVVNAMAVYAYVDEAPSGGGANGFLLTREHYRYQMAANGHEYIELPVDYPIRKMFVQGITADHDTNLLYHNFRMDIENGRKVPIDIDAAFYLDMLKSQYGPVVENHVLDAVVTAKVIFANTNLENHIVIDYDGTAFVDATSLFAVAAYTGEIINLGASVTIQADTCSIVGYVPHGVMPFDFGIPNEPESWLQTGGIKNIRLDVTAGGDADVGDQTVIITEQHVKY